MKFASPIHFIFSAIILLSLFSCNEKEEFDSAPLTDYVPVQSGKYIIYRLDSVVYTDFGTTTEIHKYQAKHEVDSEFTDLMGQQTFRIFRYLRDSAGVGAWQPNGTYTITLTTDQVEVEEDNLRFIKLHRPMRAGFTWKGNRYLPYNPYDTLGFKFSNDDDMQSWDFYYQGPDPSFTYRGNTYADIFTVEEVDESFNAPVTIPTSYGSMNRGVEKYAKGIGLVYREYEMWEYQPNPGGARGPYRIGWGLRMWMIDHN